MGKHDKLFSKMWCAGCETLTKPYRGEVCKACRLKRDAEAAKVARNLESPLRRVVRLAWKCGGYKTEAIHSERHSQKWKEAWIKYTHYKKELDVLLFTLEIPEVDSNGT